MDVDLLKVRLVGGGILILLVMLPILLFVFLVWFVRTMNRIARNGEARRHDEDGEYEEHRGVRGRKPRRRRR